MVMVRIADPAIDRALGWNMRRLGVVLAVSVATVGLPVTAGPVGGVGPTIVPAGSVASSQTWSPAGSPYVVKGQAVFGVGKTPGVLCYGAGMVNAVYATTAVTVSNSEFTDTNFSGVMSSSGASINVRNSKFSRAGCGISPFQSIGEIVDNIVDETVTSRSLYMLSPKMMSIHGNIFSPPVYLVGSYTGETGIAPTHANFRNNAFLSGVVDVLDSQESTDLRFNWWGTPIGPMPVGCWTSATTYVPAVKFAASTQGNGCWPTPILSGWFTNIYPGLASSPSIPPVGPSMTAWTAAVGASFGGLLASSAVAGDPVSVSRGNFYDVFVDLSGQGGVSGLDVTRSYNSLDTAYADGPLGTGWVGPFGQKLIPGGVDVRFVGSDGRQVTFLANAQGVFGRAAELAVDLVKVASGYQLTFAGGEVWAFDLTGQLTSKTFWDGQIVTIARTAGGRITSATSSTGPSLTFAYSTSGRLVSVTGSDGRSVVYGYNAQDFLSSVQDPAGHITTYVHDGLGRLLSLTDPTGVVVVQNVYDSAGRVGSQVLPDGTYTYGYNDVALTTTVTVSPGNETVVYQFDSSGRVLSVTDPSNKTATRSYSTTGWLNSAVARTGEATVTTVDARGNPLSLIEPGRGTATMTYDTLDRILTVADPVSGTTTYGYDANERTPTTITDAAGKVITQNVVNGVVMSEIDSDGSTTTYTYDTQHNVLTSTNAAGAVTSFEYDTAGRHTKTKTPEGRVSTTTFDAADRVLTQTGPNGGVTSYGYDTAGRLLTVTDPTGAVTTRTYNVKGQLASLALPGKPATTYLYDGLGQPTSRTDPTGLVTTTTFGVLGRVATVTDPTGRTESYTYDWAGRLASVSSPSGATASQTYNTNGQLVSTTDPLGRVTTTGYTPSGLVSAVTAPGGATTTYTYDSLGRQTGITDPTGRQTITTYTNAGRVASITDPGGHVTTLQYDSVGRETGRTDPGGGITHTSDTPDSHVATTTSPQGLITSYAYDPNGLPTTETSAAGTTTTTAWTLRGQLQSSTVSGRGTIQYSYNPDRTLAAATDALGTATQYGYDPAGRLVTRTIAGRTETWAYIAGEVTSYTPPVIAGQPATPTSYTRDTAGRINNITDPSGRTATSVFDPAGRPTAQNYANAAETLAYTFSYDATGNQNLVTAPEGQYSRSFDLAGRLLQQSDPGNRVTSWTYDTTGRRATMSNPNGRDVTYTYDALSRLTTLASKPHTPANATNTDFEDGKPIRRVYEANPKHGPTAGTDGRGREVSRQPNGGQADWQAILDCSTPNGSRHRRGVEPGTGRVVELRQHLRQEFANEIVEYYHGYVPGG